MDNQVVYIVTSYGCNSTPSDMWIPESKLFINYEDAYSYFIKQSPSLNDKYNEAEQYINTSYNIEDITKDYVIIENRVQIAGYPSGNDNCAKRPYGAVISRSIIKLN
jgi:hypothetical protein